MVVNQSDLLALRAGVLCKWKVVDYLDSCLKMVIPFNLQDDVMGLLN